MDGGIFEQPAPVPFRTRLRAAARRGPRHLVAASARRTGEMVQRWIAPEGADPRAHWIRRTMDAHLLECISALPVTELTAAEVSGESWSALPWREYEALHFPDFDLCDPRPAGPYDVVICEQVLEHVIDPFLAATSLAALCRPGGRVIVSTPFLVKQHELPLFAMYDYWRFTPRGLRHLLESAGLVVEEVHSWGNRSAVVGNLGWWVEYRRWHPLRDRRDVAVMVWAYARRPDRAEGHEDAGSSL